MHTGQVTAPIVEKLHREYLISTDPARLDLDVICAYLSTDSYWAEGRDRDTVERSIVHSHLVIGAYDDSDNQVGFARMVTDLATWAWLCDVFVLPAHGGKGLGSALVGTIVRHESVVAIKRQFLATADAHGLYAKFGFTALDDPSRWMHRSPDTDPARGEKPT